MPTDVLLIQAQTQWYDPTREDKRFVNLNLAFLQVCGLFREQAVTSQILDFNNFGFDQAKLDEALAQGPRVIVLSLDVQAVANANAIARRVRQLAPQAKLVWTSLGIGFLGPFALLFRDLILKEHPDDLVFYGSSWHLAELTKAVLMGSPWLETPGLGRMEASGPVYTPPKAAPEFLPEDYSVVDIEDYIWRWGREIIAPRHVRRQRILPVLTGISCAYRCSFCINSAREWNTRFQKKPADQLLEQLEMLIERYRPDSIWFQDDNFFIDLPRAKRALALLNRHGIKWSGQGRLDAFREDGIDEAFFREFMAPNCVWFGVGYETFSDPLRESLNKKVKTSALIFAAELCQKYAVPFNPAFVCGTAEQPLDTLISDVEGLLDFHDRFPEGTVTYQIWRPYPQTAEFKKLGERAAAVPFAKTLSGWEQDNFYGGFASRREFPWLPEEIGSRLRIAIDVVQRHVNSGLRPRGFVRSLDMLALKLASPVLLRVSDILHLVSCNPQTRRELAGIIRRKANG